MRGKRRELRYLFGVCGRERRGLRMNGYIVCLLVRKLKRKHNDNKTSSRVIITRKTIEKERKKFMGGKFSFHASYTI